ncbi:1502_t:CDS:2, partial [Ambispora leptoticha]
QLPIISSPQPTTSQQPTIKSQPLSPPQPQPPTHNYLLQKRATFQLSKSILSPPQQSSPTSVMFIYNINTKYLKNIDLIDHDQSELPASDFTATYLQDYNSIIYIGGKSSGEKLIPINQINDGNYNWRLITIAQNNQPIAIPYYHTATLINDTWKDSKSGTLIEDATSNTNQITNNTSTSNANVSSILKVDVQKNIYIWAANFSDFNPTDSIYPLRKGVNTGSIVSGVIGGILGVVILVYVIFKLCRRKQKPKDSENSHHEDIQVRPNHITSDSNNQIMQ